MASWRHGVMVSKLDQNGIEINQLTRDGSIHKDSLLSTLNFSFVFKKNVNQLRTTNLVLTLLKPEVVEQMSLSQPSLSSKKQTVSLDFLRRAGNNYMNKFDREIKQKQNQKKNDYDGIPIKKIIAPVSEEVKLLRQAYGVVKGLLPSDLTKILDPIIKTSETSIKEGNLSMSQAISKITHEFSEKLNEVRLPLEERELQKQLSEIAFGFLLSDTLDAELSYEARAQEITEKIAEPMFSLILASGKDDPYGYDANFPPSNKNLNLTRFDFDSWPKLK